jgi:hypothetical protein
MHHRDGGEADVGSGLACTKQSWKWSRSREAPVRASSATAARTAVLMVRSAAGHDEA